MNTWLLERYTTHAPLRLLTFHLGTKFGAKMLIDAQIMAKNRNSRWRPSISDIWASQPHEACVDGILLAFPATGWRVQYCTGRRCRSACALCSSRRVGQTNLIGYNVSKPSYTAVKVVISTGKSDHEAIIAQATGPPLKTAKKTRTQLTFRRRSPNQHALFLSHLSSLDIKTDTSNGVQQNFGDFYRSLLKLLDSFYPQRTITITSTDPVSSHQPSWFLRRSCDVKTD